MTVWTAIVQAFPVLFYLLAGAVVGNALMYQVDGDLALLSTRLLKIGAFVFGLVLWPLVLLYGLAQLIRAMTYSGPF